MKKNLLKSFFMTLLLCVGGMNMAWADDEIDPQEGTEEEEVVEAYSMDISLKSASIPMGSDATVTVSMKNTSEVYGAIFSVILPEGVDVVPGSAKMSEERNPKRGGYTALFAKQEDGSYKFLIQPTTLDKSIIGNEGDLLTFSINSTKVIESASIVISNIILTLDENKDVEATGGKFDFSVVDGTPGNVTVSAPAQFDIEAGQTYKIDVAMSNDFDVRAFESVITLPEGYEIVKDAEGELFSYTDRIPETMAINSSKKADNIYKVVISASDASVIAAGEGTLFSLTVKAPEELLVNEDEITITDILAFDNSASSHIAEDLVITMNHISTIGINAIEAAKAKTSVYNLAGQQVKSAKKGLYIVDGKKFIVK